MTTLATASLAAAILTTGLTAGLLYGFAHAVMPGLGRADDRTFVRAFQSIDRAIINAWFVAGFLGGPLSTVLAVALQLVGTGGAALAWLVAGLVLHAAVLAITAGIHVPLNQRLQAAGTAAGAGDLAAARARFEARWVRGNVVRTAAAVAAFGCLVAAALAQ